eukprot:CAMPEP_0181211654 /NCGR_PEP_ID=MMETSP1096-20121128/23915_1 /TAXON_ID=156174 ORGANISM="Chrysochromulina ericina, Strain CCMP281" /NCGR_SAMPLE_ID=MMETSP1096 /ASSEMBLY_ACC=CAM_ASM_000453 /LENGTH=235 /DNA_ID=CAMNT_0023303097 /DNA_START=54 /DNA_END=761 /DNA_ORIENTATION=+
MRRCGGAVASPLWRCRFAAASLSRGRVARSRHIPNLEDIKSAIHRAPRLIARHAAATRLLVDKTTVAPNAKVGGGLVRAVSTPLGGSSRCHERRGVPSRVMSAIASHGISSRLGSRQRDISPDSHCCCTSLGCLPNAPSDSQPIKRARHASNQLAAPSHFVYTRDGASSNVAASSRIEIAIWSSYRSTLPLTRRVLMSSAELAGEAAATVPASKVIGGGSGRRKTWSGRKRSTYE